MGSSWGSYLLQTSPYLETCAADRCETAVENVWPGWTGWQTSIPVKCSRSHVTGVPVTLLSQPVFSSLPSVCQSPVYSQKAWNFDPAELRQVYVYM